MDRFRRQKTSAHFGAVRCRRAVDERCELGDNPSAFTTASQRAGSNDRYKAFGLGRSDQHAGGTGQVRHPVEQQRYAVLFASHLGPPLLQPLVGALQYDSAATGEHAFDLGKGDRDVGTGPDAFQQCTTSGKETLGRSVAIDGPLDCAPSRSARDFTDDAIGKMLGATVDGDPSTAVRVTPDPSIGDGGVAGAITALGRSGQLDLRIGREGPGQAAR